MTTAAMSSSSSPPPSPQAPPPHSSSQHLPQPSSSSSSFSSSSSSSWEKFLQSPAIIYAAPRLPSATSTTSATSATSAGFNDANDANDANSKDANDTNIVNDSTGAHAKSHKSDTDNTDDTDDTDNTDNHRCPMEYYWDPSLLDRWRNCHTRHTCQSGNYGTNGTSNTSDTSNTSGALGNSGTLGSSNHSSNSGTSAISSISYGSLILLTSFVADELRQRLGLAVHTAHTEKKLAAKEANETNSTNEAKETNGRNPTNGTNGTNDTNDTNDTDSSVRIGLAIPEGPFLPLFVLAIHSLNVAVGDQWLCLPSPAEPTSPTEQQQQQQQQRQDEKTPCKPFKQCQGVDCVDGMGGVVLLPLETDEAPERLTHILRDADPDLILVAPGKDWEALDRALDGVEGVNGGGAGGVNALNGSGVAGVVERGYCANDANSTGGASSGTVSGRHTQLVDFTQLIQRAFLAMEAMERAAKEKEHCHEQNNDNNSNNCNEAKEYGNDCNNDNICNDCNSGIHLNGGLLDRWFPPLIRAQAVDSLRYSHALAGAWDVARLVAWGCVRLAEADGKDGRKGASLSFPSWDEKETRDHRRIPSHVVYTSGTTGKPKGCLSSLSSLQHYLRAKNQAHGIHGIRHTSNTQHSQHSMHHRSAGSVESVRSVGSVVLLASAITFDPCFSDVLATFCANATLAVPTRERLYGTGGDDDYENCEDYDDYDGNTSRYRRYRGLTSLLRQLNITHILCTPTLWSTVEGNPSDNVRNEPNVPNVHSWVSLVPSLEVVALGGEPIPKAVVGRWARTRKTIVAHSANSAHSSEGDHEDCVEYDREFPRLYATYGVTEACVYQTCGEVVQHQHQPQQQKQQKQHQQLQQHSSLAESNTASNVGNVGRNVDQSVQRGQSVGRPLVGTRVHICKPLPEEEESGDSDEMPTADVAESAEMAGNTAAKSLVKVQPTRTATHSSNSNEPAEPSIGEVVLSGAQLDHMSSYLNLPLRTARAFVRCRDEGKRREFGGDECFYRTGDLGYINSATGDLHILGRIKGDGMVKINGIRMELSEIESAVIDDAMPSNASNAGEDGGLVIDCMASLTKVTPDPPDAGTHDNEKQALLSISQQQRLIAYCVLSPTSMSQLKLSKELLQRGILVSPGPLLSVLKARCDRRVRKGCSPSFFVLIDRLPLSPTGKRDRSALPPLEGCRCLSNLSNSFQFGDDSSNSTLWDEGPVASFLATNVCRVLNLQPSQKTLLTSNSNFFHLGGDSLAATRICRGMYAAHHGVLDSRSLGGDTGTLEGVFAAKYLLRAKNFGEYVKFLEEHSVSFENGGGATDDGTILRRNRASLSTVASADEEQESNADPLYDSLIEAIALGYSCVAAALLDVGVNPNAQQSKGRMGKITDRNERRQAFHSNPLHLACIQGDPMLVQQLLSKGCKWNTPDATGSFPVHHACSRVERNETSEAKKEAFIHDEERNRLLCVRLLLDAGTPISIKDGNKQTLFHSAARSGHCELILFLFDRYRQSPECETFQSRNCNNIPDPRGEIFDWRDRWFRTPVHWAILNQHVKALKILLECGCKANPPKPKGGVSKRRTSVVIETPLEMCNRLYGDHDPVGEEIGYLLSNAKF